VRTVPKTNCFSAEVFYFILINYLNLIIIRWNLF
jgi:hypothetical protein